MAGLRKEPLNVSVDGWRKVGSCISVLECSSSLNWNTIKFNIHTDFIQHRVTGSLWHMNNTEASQFKEEMSGLTPTPAFTLISTDLSASGISQQLADGHLKPLLMHQEGDGRGGRAFLQACLSAGSHAGGSVSPNHDGNFRRMKGHREWHHVARIFVPRKPNTSTTVTG